MKAKVVTIIVLVSLLWPASLAALAQPGLSPAAQPQRASNRDRPSTFRGPAPMEGGSLERWTFSRRAPSGSSVTAKASDGLGNPERKAGATAIAGSRDRPSTFQGPAPMEGGSLERWTFSRRAPSGSSVTAKASDGLGNPERKAGASVIADSRDRPSTFRGPTPMQGGSLERWPTAPGTLTVGLREQEDLGCSAMEADRAWLPQFSWAAEDVAAVPSTCTGLGYGGTGDLAGHEAACSQPLP